MQDGSVKQLDSTDLTVGEVAAMLGITQSQAGSWAKRGTFGELEKVPGSHGGRDQYRIPVEVVKSVAANMPENVKRHGGGQLKTDETPVELANDAMLTLKEACELTGWHETHLSKLARNGRLDCIEVDSGRARPTRLYSRNSIEAYQANKQGGHKIKAVPGIAMPTALELLDKLEGNIRELKYAMTREEKGRKKELAARLQRLLDD